MRLYLDDIAAVLLVRALRQARHDVQTPTDSELVGAADPAHLAYAIRERRICMT